MWKIIIEDLSLWKICAKTVLKLLNENQKERLKTEADLLKKFITGDECYWIFEYEQDQESELSVEESGVTEAKESKIVKVQN